MEDNIIDLPTSRSENTGEPQVPVVEGQQELPLEERAQQSNEFMLEIVDKQRKDGIKLMNEKLEKLAAEHKTLDDPKAESDGRFLLQAAGGTAQATEALSSLMDVLIHDVGVTVQNIHRHAMGLEQISTHLQAVMNLLIEKQIVSEDELREEVGKVLNPPPPTSPTDEEPPITEEA